MSKIVLCVDDSATMQQVADITFRGTEFTYVGARSYEEGLEKAKSQKPVVVLADATLGNGKTGYELCQALKADSATQNIPVVILIGNSAPYDNAKGVASGADSNLPKPWDTQTMLEKVGEVVTKSAGGVAKVGAGASGAAPTATPAPVAAAAPGPAAKAAAAAAAPSQQPPRSATIMGMPTVKLPGGVAPVVSASTPAPGPAKTTVMAVPPMAAEQGNTGAAPGLRPPAAAAAPAGATKPPAAAQPAPTPAAVTPVSAPTPAFTPASAAPALAISGTNRAPMISGTPTKRSKLVEATLAKMAARLAEASGLEAGSPELLALLKLSTEVVERIVWEVVPELAEAIIRENLQTLTASKRPS